MTDGIIQEVFKEFIKEHPTVWLYHTDVLQKQLIENIKQEIIKIVKFNNQIESTVGEKDFQHFIFRLIGDNND